MGLFWDLIQHSQIRDQAQRSTSIEHRVIMLENQVAQLQRTLNTTLERLEKHVGADLNNDGRVG
ncbi:MAG: hypothetical protein FJ202_13490 [Gemmatimonadetes bacterium]|nr:hypothetical protein [Gemmatimonadota bacterium]